MDFLLVTVFCFGFSLGINAYPTGDFNYVCRDGEEYNMCRSPCEPTCDALRRSESNCSRSCAAGCFCRNGYVRAKDNTCVLPENCMKAHQCGENEEYQECSSPCVLNCTNMNEGIFCTKPCHSGCFCKQNFVRDARGKCVDPRTCGVVGNRHCPVNEVYVNCVNMCNGCFESPYCTTSYCSPGCDCKYGFLKNSYGECIPEDQCSTSQPDLTQEKQCGVNEIYTTCVNMCNDCISKGVCDYDQYYCTPGCDCKLGHFRNEKGICVPERNCFNQCNEDEIFQRCGPSCRSTCENHRRISFHSCKDDCVPGCFCRGNLVLGPGGRCIAAEFCPSTQTSLCPRGETYYQCMPTCRTTCRSLSNTAVCSLECKSGCFCQPGFVRNEVGRCIRPSQCPVKYNPLCPPGEVFYSCIPCPNTCENLTLPCAKKICRPGCSCQRGMVRRHDGICVRPSSCPIVCGLNQEYRSCGSLCPATCENFHQKRICSSMCVRGCFCKRGFVLTPDGRCVRRQNCPFLPPTPGFEGRRGGTTEITQSSTSTQVPSTTKGTTTDTKTATLGTAVPDSTEPATTVGKAADTSATSPTTGKAETPKAETTTKAESTTKAETTSKADATSKADTTPKADTTSKAETTPKTEPTAKAETSTNAETTSDAQSTSNAETTSQSGTTANAKTTSQAETTTKAKATSQAGTTTKAKATSKAEPTTKAEATSEAETTITKGQEAETGSPSPPSTELATPVITSPSSSEKGATGTTNTMATTSKAETTSGATAIITEKAATTVSENGTSAGP